MSKTIPQTPKPPFGTLGTKDDSDDDLLDSQASLMQDIIDQDESIKYLKLQLKKNTKEQEKGNN